MIFKPKIFYNGGGTWTNLHGSGGELPETFQGAGGSRRTSQGTVFKREVKSGSTDTIVDQVVSPFFVDVFDGQDKFLGALETKIALSTGEAALGSSYTNSNYIIETPIKRKPGFGAGELFGLDLNLPFVVCGNIPR